MQFPKAVTRACASRGVRCCANANAKANPSACSHVLPVRYAFELIQHSEVVDALFDSASSKPQPHNTTSNSTRMYVVHILHYKAQHLFGYRCTMSTFPYAAGALHVLVIWPDPTPISWVYHLFRCGMSRMLRNERRAQYNMLMMLCNAFGYVSQNIEIQHHYHRYVKCICYRWYGKWIYFSSSSMYVIKNERR